MSLEPQSAEQLRPDLEMARQHIELALSAFIRDDFPGRKHLLCIGWTSYAPSSERPTWDADIFALTPKGIERALNHAVAAAARGSDVYFKPAAVRFDWNTRSGHSVTADGEPRWPRHIGNSDIAGAGCVWIDCDVPEHFARFRDATRETSAWPWPSFHVVTGSKPALRRQSYWLLDHPHGADAAWDALSADVSAFFGSDGAVKNIGRWMRLAGFVAHPKPGKEGRVAELVRLVSGSDAAYSASELGEAFGGSAARAQRTKADPGVYSDPSRFTGTANWRDVNLKPEGGRAWRDVRALLAATHQDGQWHTSMRDAVASMIGWGWDDHAIRAACAAYGRCDGGPDDPDLSPLLGGARAKWARPHVEPGASNPENDFEARSLEIKRTYEVNRSCDYLVKGLLDRNTLAVTYGGPKAGKTFVMLDLALHVALGRPWQGYKTKEARVVYNCAEGGSRFGNRIYAALEGGEQPASFGYIDTPVVYDDHIDFAEIRARLHEHGGCDFLVIDTVARSMSGDENLARDVNLFVRALDCLRNEFDCTVLGVHHSGKDETKGGRGSNALVAAVNTELALIKGEGHERTLKTTAQRDGAEGEIELDLEPYDLGVDAEGDAISTLRVKPRGKLGSAPRRDRRKPITGVNRTVFEALVEYADAGHGQPNPGGAGWPAAGSVKTVDRETFRAFAAGRLTGDNASNRRMANRALKALFDLGYAGANENQIWPIIAGEGQNVQ